MNANQLKKSILQYAVEGKLTKQNPDFESAQTLIASIEAKKQIMIQNKEIKNEKTVANVITENIPYSLPENWEWATLQSVTSKITDGSHNPPKDSGEGFQIISAKNIIDGSINFDASNRFVSQSDFEKEDKRTNIRRGDLLLCIVGSIGKTAIVDTDIPFTAQRSVAIIKTFIDVNFLKVVVESPFFLEFLFKKSAGTAQKGVYLNTLKEALIPIPPIEEQKRIVNKIKELFVEIDSYDNHYLALEALNKRFPKDLEKSILQFAIQGKLVNQDTSDEPSSELLKRISEQKERMIKEKIIKKEKPLPPITEEEIPFDIPETWEWVRLKNISTFGNFNQASPEKINPDDWVLDLKEIEKNTGRILEQKTASEKTIKSNKYKFNQNDVLYGKLRPYLNKVTIAPHEGYCTTEIFPITLIKGVYPKYIQYVLMSPYFLNYAHSLSYGVKMPRLGTTQIANALIPLPPANEQIKIVEKIEEMIKPVRNLSLLNER